jgi:PucR C-terminal helix-turn-helix domain
LARPTFFGLGVGRDDSSNQVPGHDGKEIAVDVRDGDHCIRLGPLLNTTAEERDLLPEPLQTDFTAGSIADAAKLLFCQGNSVPARLSRIADLTGRSVDNPSGAVELYIANQALLRLPKPPG